MAIPQGQGWYVQLGAYSSRAAAAGAWGSARGKVGALAGLSPAYSQAGRMTRLRAGPVNGKMAAAGLCKIAGAGRPAMLPGRSLGSVLDTGDGQDRPEEAAQRRAEFAAGTSSLVGHDAYSIASSSLLALQQTRFRHDRRRYRVRTLADQTAQSRRA